jgi:tetratricopeptide (TPR) repeat protein
LAHKGIIAAAVACILLTVATFELRSYFSRRSLEHRWRALALADSQIQGAKFDDAIRTLKKAKADFGDFRETEAALGHAFVGAQRYPEALAAYTAAIKIDKNYAAAYLGRGWINWFTGSLDSAVSDYKTLIALSPENIAYYLELERCLYELNQPKAVADLWKNTFEKYPKWTNARLWRVNALVRAEEWSTIRRELADIIKDYPDSPYYLYLLGKATDEAREFGEAIPYLKVAVDLASKSKDADSASLQIYGEELVHAYLWAGERDEARQAETDVKQVIEARNRPEG